MLEGRVCCVVMQRNKLGYFAVSEGDIKPSTYGVPIHDMRGWLSPQEDVTQPFVNIYPIFFANIMQLFGWHLISVVIDGDTKEMWFSKREETS